MTKPRPFLNAETSCKSVVIGAPDNFDFLQVLRQANSIKFAVAFGHMTGWKKLGRALKASKASSIQILLGQAFLQTEPDLLDFLQETGAKNPSRETKLAPVAPTFHPKVWIIESQPTTHLLIGSANLSGGGLIGNHECSAYLSDPSAIGSALSWFDQIWRESSRLTPKLCGDYRLQYEKLRQQRDDLRDAINDATNKLQLSQNLFRRDDAIREARKYFDTPEGRLAGQERGTALDRIRKCLNPPDFNFTKDQWVDFLSIAEFGSLRRIPRITSKRLPQIRRAFRHLACQSIPLAKRFDDVVPQHGKLHVANIGQNIATKVLAILRPQEQPVYNERVKKTLLAFGYSFDSSKSEGDQYAEFCRQVRDFASRCGLKDVVSIDAFFEYYSRLPF